MPQGIRKSVPLAPHTTLGVGGIAEFFAEVNTREKLIECYRWAQREGLKVSILGSGSNVLVPDVGVRGLVVKLQFHEYTFTNDDTDDVYVRAGASVILDVLIEKVAEQHVWGMENLSAIPGTIGAVPIQNVGAYGVEAKDIVHAVTVYDSVSNSVRTISNAECMFAYRDSFFKHIKGAHLVILEVVFKLSKIACPKLSYRDVEEHAKNMPHGTPSEIRTMIRAIRSNKFPDYTLVGTAGSFFKNPIITREQFETLKTRYADLPGYREENGMIKVSLGFILDRICELKGYREGNVWLYEKQALVLVCKKNILAKEIELFSEKINDLVFEKIGIHIEREVTTLA